MPLDLPITTEARYQLGVRVPSHKPTIDGTDAAGLVQVALDAIAQLEVLIRELQVENASIGRMVK